MQRPGRRSVHGHGVQPLHQLSLTQVAPETHSPQPGRGEGEETLPA